MLATMNRETVARHAVWPVMVLPFFAALFYFVIFADSPIASALYAATKLFTLSWPIVALIWIERSRISKQEIFDRRHLRAIPLGLLTGGGIGAVLLVGYYFTPLGDHVAQCGPQIRAKAEQLGFLELYIPFVLALSFINSAIEEYFWRWYVFGRLSRILPVVPAMIIAGFAFGAHHYVVLATYFPVWSTALFGTGVAIGGMIWCWQMAYQRSLAGAWVSHIIVDIVAMVAVGYPLVMNATTAS
jgi:membrane protease YdiL (CAAX protease family)